MTDKPEPVSALPFKPGDYIEGVLSGNRAMLARTITLLESEAPRHQALAEQVLQALLSRSGGSIRVGITGVPGVGKSTFIEALGLLLCRRGHRVAVLAVDPSSAVSRGSILGDKTRMEELSREPNAFIRPSPSGGTLGGVARKSRESLLACEAAGFDVVMVETVGVGQSETTVCSMVDFFLVLLLAGAGDELQGIKKGITELADALIITKADGDNKARAAAARSELEGALHYLAPLHGNWKPRVLTCSSLKGEGIAEAWSVVEAFRDAMSESGALGDRRRSQTLDWIREMLEGELWRAFAGNPAVARTWPEIEKGVLEGNISPAAAVRVMLEAMRKSS